MTAKIDANKFLENMALGEEEEAPKKTQPKPQSVSHPKPEPAPRVLQPSVKRRKSQKHIGGYFDSDTLERIALLRARLDLDNSELLKLAIDELYSKERAKKAFSA
jgi:hypothetical protein